MKLGALFWRFWAASGLSNVADGMVALVLTLTALSLTREPLLISGLGLVEQLPWLLFSLVAGALADRLDRRHVLLGVNAARVAVLAAVAVLALVGGLTIWLVFLIALVLGMGETLFDTSEQSIVPSIVRSDQLERANSRMQGVEVATNYFLGPGLGGLIATVSMVAAFATGSALYLVAAIAVFALRGSYRPERAHPPASIRADVSEGLRYLRTQPVLRRLGVLSGLRMLTFSAVTAILALYAVAPGPMGLSSTGYGFFAASTAIGAVIASVTGERTVAHLGAAGCLRVTFVAFAITEAAPLAVNPVAVGALWMIGTYFVIVWNVVTLTVRQRLVPGHLMGRVNAVFRLVTFGAMPVGSLLGGTLMHLTGARFTFTVCALGTLLLSLGTLALTDEALVTGRFARSPKLTGPAQAGADQLPT
ncbi:MAG TPA: MFS transporter [Kineosporiaceae bacterium]